MSASIFWDRPANRKPLNVDTPSRFIEQLRTVFGALPYTFTQADLPRLEAMAAVGGGPWQELVELVEQYETICVWAEY